MGVLRVIRETYQLDAGKCSCVASTHVSENFIDCPGGIVFKRSVGPCQPKPDAKGEEVGDRFRLVTWNTISRDGCKCVQKTHRVLEACGKIQLSHRNCPNRMSFARLTVVGRIATL
ncbi:unnamed protein product [Dibothriocephalus latus]|uniref:Uncharacterized protein n=1 Tax=Dibothriocephalus latus TaxID=60516 RepID=A0A3P7RMU0_DIBLA|nr:unnamed protein product [Dibothriocephalus latus]